MNTQPATGNCSFILGLTKGNGEDIENGAAWDIEYVEGKGFTLRNVATALYLKDAAPAKYETAAYFNFLVKDSASGITSATIQRDMENDVVHNLQGVKVGTRSQLKALPRGIYIIGGKKLVVR